MSLAICRVSQENVDRVLAQPRLIHSVVAPAARQGRRRSRRLAGWFGRPQRPAAIVPTEAHSTDLEQAWHGIHYLLTRSAWDGDKPLDFLLHGGTQVGDIEIGYGPARILSSDEVREVANALAAIDEAELRSRFDPEEMSRIGIYPRNWHHEPSREAGFGYCAGHFARLRDFVEQAAQRNEGVVIYLA